MTTDTPEDNHQDDDEGPLDNAELFERSLEDELFNDTLSEGIDDKAHNVGRVYEAQGTAHIDVTAHDDGTKEIYESDDITPTWHDQGYWRCHTCGLRIKHEAIAFLHASDDAAEFVEHLPPAIRANVSELSRLNEFGTDSAD